MFMVSDYEVVVPCVIEKQNKKTCLQLAGFSQVQIQTLGSGKRMFLNLIGSYTLSDQIT